MYICSGIRDPRLESLSFEFMRADPAHNISIDPDTMTQ